MTLWQRTFDAPPLPAALDVEDQNDVGAQCRKPRGVFRARGFLI